MAWAGGVFAACSSPRPAYLTGANHEERHAHAARTPFRGRPAAKLPLCKSIGRNSPSTSPEDAFAPKGQSRVAGGASPRSLKRNRLSPARGDVEPIATLPRRFAAPVSPVRCFNRFLDPLPGTGAPGYTPRPLWGQYICTSWPCFPSSSVFLYTLNPAKWYPLRSPWRVGGPGSPIDAWTPLRSVLTSPPPM